MKAHRELAIPEEVFGLYKLVKDPSYPCLGAKSALANDRISYFVARDLCSAENDHDVVRFLYDFIDTFRLNRTALSSAVVIFSHTPSLDEDEFDRYLWERLQAFADIDASMCAYDIRVSDDPASPNFSFSIKEEGLYVIGLHPRSRRKARQFLYPTLVFNPHQQFDQLRLSGKYETMKNSVRQRDIRFSGSVNPMLRDFGTSSEANQYTGKVYDTQWQCPFVSRHRRVGDDFSQNGSGVHTE